MPSKPTLKTHPLGLFAGLLVRGPWVDLEFFDVSILAHCTLHILNLKLLGISNGSALPLVRDSVWPFGRGTDHLDRSIPSVAGAC